MNKPPEPPVSSHRSVFLELLYELCMSESSIVDAPKEGSKPNVSRRLCGLRPSYLTVIRPDMPPKEDL